MTSRTAPDHRGVPNQADSRDHHGANQKQQHAARQTGAQRRHHRADAESHTDQEGRAAKRSAESDLSRALVTGGDPDSDVLRLQAGQDGADDKRRQPRRLGDSNEPLKQSLGRDDHQNGAADKGQHGDRQRKHWGRIATMRARIPWLDPRPRRPRRMKPTVAKPRPFRVLASAELGFDVGRRGNCVASRVISVGPHGNWG
jgi:hypothetical protein